MATETGRHRLYEKIKEQWGEEHAAELMSYLPPVGWADVATKQDLDALRAATKQDLENVALRLESRIDRGLASQARWTVGTMVAMTGIFGMLVNWLH